MSALLDIRGLTVDIPTRAGLLHAVRGVDLSLDAGETFGIVGESGCGKSMTAMSILGLLPRLARVTADRMTWQDSDMLAFDAARWAGLRGPSIAAIFQEPMTALNPVLSIGDQMTEGYLSHGLGDRTAARRRAGELLERVAVTPVDRRLRQYPHELSGGLRQRVMIAMALMCRPRLLLADEPTTALDVSTQVEILSLLRELQRETGMALLLITHDLGVVAHMAERLAVMYAGEVVETGTVADVLHRPAHPYTGALLRCLPAQARRGQPLEPIAGVVPALVGDLHGCSFRNRCTYALAACAGTIPLQQSGDGHAYRCVLPADAAREMKAAGA